MLCEKCQSREATVHITAIVGEQMERHDLCAVCAPIGADGTPEVELSQFLDSVTSLRNRLDEVASETAYPVEALVFVRESLDHAISVRGSLIPRHVSGAELLEAFKQLAVERFGKEAKATLRSWGITRTGDVGEIVFSLVEANLLGKQPSDSREDFRDRYNFDEAFPEV